MVVISTKDGAVYSLEMRAVGADGRMLAICRSGGVDDPPHTNVPMEEGRWYHVNVLTPLPPQIGASIDMILDPIADDATPVIRKTGPVMGLVEPKGVVRDAGVDDGGASIDDAMAGAGPGSRQATSLSSTRTAMVLATEGSAARQGLRSRSTQEPSVAQPRGLREYCVTIPSRRVVSP